MPDLKPSAPAHPEVPEKPAKKRRSKSAHSRAAADAPAAPSAAPSATPFAPPPAADPGAPVKVVAAAGESAHAPAPKSMAQVRRIRIAETAEGYAKLRATLEALQNSSAEPDEHDDPKARTEQNGRNGEDDLNEEPDAVAMDALGGWEDFEGDQEAQDADDKEDEQNGRQAVRAAKAAGSEPQPAKAEKAEKKARDEAASKAAGETKEKRRKAAKEVKRPKAQPCAPAATEEARDAHDADESDGLFPEADAAGGQTAETASPDPFLVPRGPNRRLSTSREALAGALGRSVAAPLETDEDPQEEPESQAEAPEPVDALEAGAHFTRLEGRRLRLPGDAPPRPVRDLLDPEVALSLERISNPGWGAKMMAEGARLWKEENARREEALFASLSEGEGLPPDEKARLAREDEAAKLYADPAQSDFTGEISARPELWAVFKDDVAGAQTTALRLDCRGLEKRITELARADIADPRIPPLVEHYEALSTRLEDLVRVQAKEGAKAAKRVSRLGAAGFAGVPAEPLPQGGRLTHLLARLTGGPEALPAAHSTPTEAWLAALAKRTPAGAGAAAHPEGAANERHEALLEKLWTALAENDPAGSPSARARKDGASGAQAPQNRPSGGPHRFVASRGPAPAGESPTLFARLDEERPADPALEEKLMGLLSAQAAQEAQADAPKGAADAACLSRDCAGVNPPGETQPPSQCGRSDPENPSFATAPARETPADALHQKPAGEAGEGEADAAQSRPSSQADSPENPQAAAEHSARSPGSRRGG